MKRLLLIALLVAWMTQAAGATTIAYIVNADTVYANLTYDRQWIDLFKDDMGLTVKVITDDSAGAITSVDAYDGYFASATMTSANLTNLRASTKGIVICDQLLYDDFLVASGQTSVLQIGNAWYLDRVTNSHPVTQYMSNRIVFDHSGNAGVYAYTGLPSGATVLFSPTVRNWTGDVDTAFCYAIETGDSLVGAIAAGRRVVNFAHYGLLTSQSDAGWCHPYELMGNIAGWAWGIEDNIYNANYNCYSTERATPPECQQCWTEYGTNWRYIYNNGRTGYDQRLGLMFLSIRDWAQKAMVGTEPDSFVFTYKIPYRSYGTDSPPTLTDTITLGTIISSTRALFDTTTLNRSYTDLKLCGQNSRAFVIRSGTGADTVQRGDTISLVGGSRNGTNDTLYYSRTAAGFFNGVDGTQIRLSLVDPYSGHSYWAKMYEILPTNEWNCPLAYLNEGGNPEGSATRTWVNRNYIVNGATGAVAWNAMDLTPGIDHSAAAIDSFLFNSATFSGDGTDEVRLVIPGSYLNNPDFNWVVIKSIDSSGGGDSTDTETIPQSVNVVRGSTVQRFEVFMSTASPLVLGVDDSVLTITAEVDEVVDPLTNYIRNTGDGVLAIESVTDNKSWMVQTTGGGGGNTPLLVFHALNTAGPARVDTATVTVTASTASNSPLTYLVIMTLTEPAVEVPPGAVPKRTGLRLQ